MGGGVGDTLGHLGSVWGISKQVARKKWPGPVDDGSGQPGKIRWKGIAGLPRSPAVRTHMLGSPMDPKRPKKRVRGPIRSRGSGP